MSVFVSRYATRQLAALALAVGLAMVVGFASESIGRSPRYGLPDPAAPSPTMGPTTTFGPTPAAGIDPASPATMFEGIATIVDGDTINVGDARVRLEGIDAPENGQTCKRRDGSIWACGSDATALLFRMAHGRHVTCRNQGIDKYGRVLGLCRQGGIDLNGEMVRQGLAWAFVRYSTVYVDLEATARRAGVGVWQGEAKAPWDYRAERWVSAAGSLAPNGCAIKGNVTVNGRIYHMPWSPWYAQIHMDEAKGRRWFCSENEALAAGWRPAQAR